jgi:ABC-type phosphate/phosphonate transport system substrate-binding protein
MVAVFAVGAGLATTVAAPRAAENEAVPAGTVRIGMVNTLFRDYPETLITALMQPFGALMEAQTGLTGQLVPGGNAIHLGQMLSDNVVQLGVFHGVEFAWARQQYPSIRPLMIAVNQQRNLRAVIMVRADASAEKFADLKGKTLAVPCRSREHCHLFLERLCPEQGQPVKEFFAQITNPGTGEDALDDVVDNVVQAVVADAIAIDSYKRRKPTRFNRLKVLETSEVFPAAVVAYHPGVLKDTTLQQFREGMLNANKAPLGRQFMTLWKLTGFEPIPDDYEQLLTSISRVYPPPKPD